MPQNVARLEHLGGFRATGNPPCVRACRTIFKSQQKKKKNTRQSHAREAIMYLQLRILLVLLLSCFFSGRRQKGTRARTLNNEKRKGGLMQNKMNNNDKSDPLSQVRAVSQCSGVHTTVTLTVFTGLQCWAALCPVWHGLALLIGFH